MPTTTSSTLPLTETNNAAPLNGVSSGDSWLEVVRGRLDGLRYGVIQIVVHDGRVTQVECTEKVRFDSGRTRDAARLSS
jgi:hypothetical protein